MSVGMSSCSSEAPERVDEGNRLLSPNIELRQYARRAAAYRVNAGYMTRPGSARASIQCRVETHHISTSVDIVDHSGASPYRRMSGSSSLPM
jgi:hypothetical protein